MNWEAIGAIAEMLGATAVIFSLVYLALQIRHSIKQDKKRAIEAVYLSYNDIRHLIITNEELARIFVTGISHPEELSDLNRGRFFGISESMFMNAESFWKQLDGEPDERWDKTLEYLSHYLTKPGGKEFWKSETSYNLTNSFRLLIEKTKPPIQARIATYSADLQRENVDT